MRQSSESFMEEMLKLNNAPTDNIDLSKQIGDIIDKKMEQAMERFNAEVSKINKPIEDAEASTVLEENEIKEDKDNEETGEEVNE